jgi:hypothetical protein
MEIPELTLVRRILQEFDQGQALLLIVGFFRAPQLNSD